MASRTLAHNIDIEWLQEAYRRTRKGGAVGVDEQTSAAGTGCGKSARPDLWGAVG